jgi:hypothetical protein
MTNAINWPADVSDELGSIPDYDGASGAYAYHYCAKGVDCSWDYGGGDTEETTLSASTKAKLYVGGKASVGQQVLVCVTYTAEEIDQPLTGGHITALGNDMTTLSTALGQQVGSDGKVWIVLPAGAVVPATLTAPANHYAADATDVVKYNSHLEVFVCQPYPGFKYSGESYGLPPPVGFPLFRFGVNAGHAWWKLWTDAPTYIVNQKADANASQWLNTEVGYGYTNHLNWLHAILHGTSPTAPGELPFADSDTATTNPTYTIGFPGLIGGLNHTENVHESPGTYNLRHHNCVTETIYTAAAAGITLPNDWDPEHFGADLPPGN